MPHILSLSLSVAILVFLAVVVLDILYVIYTSAVSSGRRLMAATSSMILHLTSALVIIAYTKTIGYLAVVAAGSWVGTYVAMLWSGKKAPKPAPARDATAGAQPARPNARPTSAQAQIQAQAR